MRLVLDACAAMEIALNRGQAQAFRARLGDADLVLAPDIFPSEITNSFWKYGRNEELSWDACEKGIQFCLDLVDDYIDTKSLCREALFESIKRNHPSYDLFYLVLARRNTAGLLTRDVKMKKLARDMQIGCLE